MPAVGPLSGAAQNGFYPARLSSRRHGPELPAAVQFDHSQRGSRERWSHHATVSGASTTCGRPLARGPKEFHHMTFESLGLSPALLRALTEQNYNTPTPIQAEAIPLALAGHDLLGGAQTGTGKTAAFGLPLLNRLSKQTAANGSRVPRALVLVPTRELAVQVTESLRGYGKHLRMNITAIYGGAGMGPQVEHVPSRRRRARRHPGPPDRPHGARHRQARRDRDPGAGRSRPHARHGLPAGDQAHPRPSCRASARRCCSRPRSSRRSSSWRWSSCASPSRCRSPRRTPSPRPSPIAPTRSTSRASATCWSISSASATPTA